MAKQNDIIWAIGSRKTASARVRMIPGNGKVMVNSQSIDGFFAGHERQKLEILRPLNLSGVSNKYDIFAQVSGGGVTGQADALKMGIARALSQLDEKTRKMMRQEGYLTRDSRMVERKKPGQPKARKRFQYSKR